MSKPWLGRFSIVRILAICSQFDTQMQDNPKKVPECDAISR